MGLGKYKVEGGQGGKKGHSNMTHWEHTEDIKRKVKSKRRMQGKEMCREATKEI